MLYQYCDQSTYQNCDNMSQYSSILELQIQYKIEDCKYCTFNSVGCHQVPTKCKLKVGSTLKGSSLKVPKITFFAFSKWKKTPKFFSAKDFEDPLTKVCHSQSPKFPPPRAPLFLLPLPEVVIPFLPEVMLLRIWARKLQFRGRHLARCFNYFWSKG